MIQEPDGGSLGIRTVKAKKTIKAIDSQLKKALVIANEWPEDSKERGSCIALIKILNRMDKLVRDYQKQ